MITVVVTCWDQCLPEDSEQNQKYIREKLGKLQINSVLFVGLKDSAKSICNQIDQIIAISKQNKVELSEDDIYGNFDLTDYDYDEQNEMIQQHQHLQKRGYNYFKIAKQQIDYLSKAIQEKFIEEFEINQLKKINKLKDVNQLKGLFQEYESFVKYAQQSIQRPYNIEMDQLIRQKSQNQQLQHKEELMEKIQEQTSILRKQRAK